MSPDAFVRARRPRDPTYARAGALNGVITINYYNYYRRRRRRHHRYQAYITHLRPTVTPRYLFILYFRTKTTRSSTVRRARAESDGEISFPRRVVGTGGRAECKLKPLILCKLLINKVCSRPCVIRSFCVSAIF